MTASPTAAWTHRFVQTNGIRMHVVEQGEGYPVLLIHGFPELWYSWRYQLPALAAAGFRAIAPDLRGYGETDKPEGIEAYDIHHLVADMTGLLDAQGVEKAAIAGHDWGGIIVWQMALMAPERVERVIGVNTPFLPRTPIKPTDAFKMVPDGRFNYILYFQEPGVAEQAMMADLRGALDGMMRRIAKDPGFISDADLQVYVDAFAKGGLTGPINYYRNFDRNWETTASLAGKQVTQPSLMITAEFDPILTPEMADGMEAHVPNLRKVLVKDSGHWTQQEKPDDVNRAIIEFLSDLSQ